MTPVPRPRVRLRRSNHALAAPALPLALLVLVPIVLVVGLMAAIPTSGSSAPAPPPSGITVRISAMFPCVDPCAPIPYSLHFTAIVSGEASTYVYLWSFGDGSTSAFGPSVGHTFPNCAAYVVTVWVAGAVGTASNSSTFHACAA